MLIIIKDDDGDDDNRHKFTDNYNVHMTQTNHIFFWSKKTINLCETVFFDPFTNDKYNEKKETIETDENEFCFC